MLPKTVGDVKMLHRNKLTYAHLLVVLPLRPLIILSLGKHYFHNTNLSNIPKLCLSLSGRDRLSNCVEIIPEEF